MIRALDQGGPATHPFDPFPSDALDGTVYARFAEICRRYPARIAIVDRERRISYEALGKWVRQLAAAIPAAGDAGPVGILCGHRAAYPAVMLAALGSGRGYVPMDPQFPQGRNRGIVDHAGVRVILADAPNIKLAGALGATVLPISMVEGKDRDSSWAAKGAADSLAYVIYTSGSTGKPKGVFQNQRNLLHDVMQYVNSIHLSYADRSTALYSCTTNGAIRDVFGCLLTGATLCLYSVREVGLSVLHDVLVEERPTIFHSVPVLFRQIMTAMGDGQKLTSVRLAYMAGDRVEPGDLRLFRLHFPASSYLYIGMGSTENATIYRQWFFAPGMPVPDGPVPVGHAVPDRPMALLEDGEIEVTSRYLALGYWNDPALTAARFLASFTDPEARVFRTGDLGRLRADGQLDFLGRADSQVKIRGYRVELSEVERALRAVRPHGEVAVMFHEGALVAFLEGPQPAGDLRAELGLLLPSYMIPSRFHWPDRLPLLTNFKVDRAALVGLLPDLAIETQAIAEDPTEDAVLQIMSQALGRTIARDDDFFDRGGDSLRALIISQQMEKRLGRWLPPDAIFLLRKPRAIAGALRHAHESSPLVHFQWGLGAPLILLPPLSDDFSVLLRIRSHLPDSRLAGLRQPLDTGAVSIEDRAARMRDVLLAADLPRPFLLLGVCYGGRLAFEVAALLKRAGEPVAFLGILDCTPSGWLDPRQPRTLFGFPVGSRAGRLAALIHIMVYGPERGYALRELWARAIRARLKRWQGALQGQAETAEERTLRLQAQQRISAFGQYTPSKFGGTLHLFRTRGWELGWKELPEDLGWGKYCTRVHPYTATGPHQSIGEDAFEEIARCVRAADGVIHPEIEALP